MPDPVVPPADPPAPPPAVPPKVEPPVPPAPAPPADPKPIGITSEQLKERLAENAKTARAAALKDLGFPDEASAKAALKKLTDLETASLSEKEKLEKQIAELTPKAARGDAAHARLTAIVDAQFAALPEAVQAAIDATAKGDPDKRLDAMAIVAAATGAVPPPVPKPPGPGNATPPVPPAPGGAPTKFQEWEAMNSRSHALGNIFYQNHTREIEKTRPATP